MKKILKAYKNRTAWYSLLTKVYVKLIMAIPSKLEGVECYLLTITDLSGPFQHLAPLSYNIVVYLFPTPVQLPHSPSLVSPPPCLGFCTA